MENTEKECNKTLLRLSDKYEKIEKSMQIKYRT